MDRFNRIKALEGFKIEDDERGIEEFQGEEEGGEGGEGETSRAEGKGEALAPEQLSREIGGTWESMIVSTRYEIM